MSAITAINAAIYSALGASTALVTALGGTYIYERQAPDDKDLPYVVYSFQGGGPENISPGNLQSDLVYVRAYAGTPGQDGTIDGYCQTALHRQTLTVTGFTNIWTAREEDIVLVENPPGGKRIYTAGGIYRIRLS